MVRIRCKQLLSQSGVVISQGKTELCCRAVLAIYFSQLCALAFRLSFRCLQKLPARCSLSNEVSFVTRNSASDHVYIRDLGHIEYNMLYNVCRFSSLDGRKEKVMFDKITSRISKLCYGLKEDYVDAVRRAMKC